MKGEEIERLMPAGTDSFRCMCKSATKIERMDTSVGPESELKSKCKSEATNRIEEAMNFFKLLYTNPSARSADEKEQRLESETLSVESPKTAVLDWYRFDLKLGMSTLQGRDIVIGWM